jgi:hypothetical protein
MIASMVSIHLSRATLTKLSKAILIKNTDIPTAIKEKKRSFTKHALNFKTPNKFISIVKEN